LRLALVPLALIALTFVPSPAAAHPFAVVVDAPNGERCYVAAITNSNYELWVETNGVLAGGVGHAVDEVAPGTLGPTGLQRTTTLDENGRDIPADTRLEPDAWAARCLGP
jgi:hypothetical protein